MIEKKRCKWMLEIGILFLFVAVSFSGIMLFRSMDRTDVDRLVFDRWLNDKREVFREIGPDIPVDINGDPARDDSLTRSGGGTLEWEQTLFPGEALSSPALVDLDNNNDMEIVIASAGDAVFALGPDGRFLWDEPYADDVIDYLGQTTGTSGLDFEPPPIFSSVISADVNLGDTPETIIGVKNGALCIGSDGSKQWRKGMTTGYYFSTPCITDLEGEWTGNKEDLEIILASDDESRRGWLEAFEVDGGAIFREDAPTGGEGGLIGCSVVAHDLDGDFWDGPVLIDPEPSKERDTELIIGNHDRALRIWVRQGENAEGKPNYDEMTSANTGGHQTYATTAIANVTGDPACEIFTGCSEGSLKTWTGWGGRLYCFSSSGKQLRYFSTGNIKASIFSSPAIADLQVAKDDPEEKELKYEVIFGCDNGIMYVLDAEGLNLLWSFDTGGRVLSSPAICNIDNDGELEIVIGSDSGKVFCLDGDPSDGVDEGIAYPGDGSGYDVLWAYDTKDPIGISSPVVADIDLDGKLEVVIGNQEGHVFCISAGGRAVKGQSDWPEFHCDLNRTGFYNPQLSYGVDLYAKKDKNGRSEPMVRSISPGSEVMYNITVENTGVGISEVNKDIIYVGIQGSSVPVDWRAWLDTPPDRGNDNPGYVRLSSQEKVDLVLHVFAPWEGDIGEMARINVTANSSSNQWARDTLTTMSVFDLFVDFDLGFNRLPSTDPLDPLVGQKWERIGPGEERDFQLTISNKGNLNDSYEIVLSPPPKEAGWNWYFIETKGQKMMVNLTAGALRDVFGGISSKTFTIKVEVPSGAAKDQRIPVQVAGTSVLSRNSKIEEIRKTDTLVMIVGVNRDLVMYSNDPTLHVDPNSSVEFSLYLMNNGNQDLIRVLLSSSQTPKGWTMSSPSGPIEVYQGQSKLVVVKVTAPRYARANEKLVLTITGVIEGSPNYKDEVILTTIVNHVYDFDAVVLNKEGIRIDPGKTQWFAIQVSNLGNTEDILKPSAYQIKLDWNLTFYNVEGYQKYELLLDFDTSMTIKGLLKIPFNTRTGRYDVALNLTGIGSSKIVFLKVFVNQTYDLQVRSLSGSNNLTSQIRPDQERAFTITVSNFGNGPERVALKLGAKFDPVKDQMELLYDGWGGKFVAVANTNDFTTNIRTFDFREPVPISNMVPDVYYTPNYTASSDVVEEIRELVLILDKGQTAYVHLVLKAPYFETSSEIVSVDVSGKGVGGQKDFEVTTLYLELLFPDMKFVDKMVLSGGSGSRNTVARVGEMVTIQVKVHNTGDIPAEDVDIRLYIDGVEKSTRTLKVLKNDSDDIKTVVFTWVAEAGEHKIKVVIDPDNDVIEVQGGEEDDNVLAKTVRVRGSSIVNDVIGDDPIVNVVLILIFAVVIIVGIALLMKKRHMI